MNDQDALTAYAATFVDELAQNDVKHVVISPGSRSTPLAMLFAEHPDIEIHLNIDERSAAFFALGLAKALREPVAIVCTSGTAAANYYPAVVEAYYARIPLIVLTADRPHELRDVGAPQAIDQIHLYGKHAKWFVEMALPEQTDEMIRYARSVGARSVATAASEPCGPVHLNFPLREPLVPKLDQVKRYRTNRSERQPAILIETGSLRIGERQITALAESLGNARRGLIVCGELVDDSSQEAIIQLAEKLGFPVLADPLSQLRSGKHNKDLIVETYDTILRDSLAQETLRPDVVLRFGSMPVSKALLLFLKKQANVEHFVVDSGAGWREPAGLVSTMIYSNETFLCHELLNHLPEQKKTDWLNKWQTVNEVTRNALATIRDDEELNEGKLFLVMPEQMPVGSTFVVGNSMPIRDLDTFFFANDKQIRTIANRGANGIDGVVSTALGVSTVSEHTVLAIGDLSFFHDMNGLLAAKLQKQNLTIVLINNDGGGIFSFLPQSSEEVYFEQLFGTPHSLQFEHAAHLYEAKYDQVQSWDHFEQVFKEGFETPGLKIIEIQTERRSNVVKHRNLWKFVSQEIATVLDEGI